MQALRRRVSQTGFTYIGALILVAAMGLALTLAAQVWRTGLQRDKEAQLLFVGNQFREAISRYYARSPGAARQFPSRLEDLLKDNRFPQTVRHLRRIYVDPVTGKPDWALVMAPGGGIRGVRSLSNAEPVKVAGFAERDAAFSGAKRYSDWVFAVDGDSMQTPRATPATASSRAPAQGGR